jgi:hypothetical protein
MNVNGMGTERMRKTRETLNAWRAESQAKARRAVRITDNYAHDHPWRMVTTAGALALAAGLLIRGASTRKSSAAVKNLPLPRKPTVKVIKAKAKPKHSPWDAIHALAPLVLLGLKAWQSSHAAKAAAPVNVNPPAPATEYP